MQSVFETSAVEEMSKPTKAMVTLETIIMISDLTAFTVPSYLESIALAGVRQHVVMAEVFFLVDMILVVSGNITREQARNSVSRVTNLPDANISVTVRGQGNLGRRTQFLQHDEQGSMLEITLETTDAQLARAAAQKTCDTSALTRAFTEQTAFVKSLEVEGCAQAVLVSTHVEAGQTLNTAVLSTTLSQKLGANVSASILEDGRFDELLFAAAQAAPQQEASEVGRSGIDTSSSEIFVTTLAPAAMVASCLMLAVLCRWKLQPSQQSKAAPMHLAVPAWLPPA